MKNIALQTAAILGMPLIFADLASRPHLSAHILDGAARILIDAVLARVDLDCVAEKDGLRNGQVADSSAVSGLQQITIDDEVVGRIVFGTGDASSRVQSGVVEPRWIVAHNVPSSNVGYRNDGAGIP